MATYVKKPSPEEFLQPVPEAVKDFACPTCKAKPGEKCRRIEGAVHGSRVTPWWADKFYHGTKVKLPKGRKQGKILGYKRYRNGVFAVVEWQNGTCEKLPIDALVEVPKPERK